MNIHNPFTLPELEFVGGSTQELVFHCYHEQNGKPTELSSCTANFSLISYVNKYGSPLISKAMEIRAGTDDDEGICNILAVVLEPSDTLELRGKYIYQIALKDVTGLAEIPGQGLFHINNNINKGFIS